MTQRQVLNHGEAPQLVKCLLLAASCWLLSKYIGIESDPHGSSHNKKSSEDLKREAGRDEIKRGVMEGLFTDFSQSSLAMQGNGHL